MMAEQTKEVPLGIPGKRAECIDREFFLEVVFYPAHQFVENGLLDLISTHDSCSFQDRAPPSRGGRAAGGQVNASPSMVRRHYFTFLI